MSSPILPPNSDGSNPMPEPAPTAEPLTNADATDRALEPIEPIEVDWLLAGYVLNDLDADEAAALAQRWDEAAIQQTLQELQTSWDLVNLPAPVQPAAALRSRILAEADPAARSLDSAPPEPLALSAASESALPSPPFTRSTRSTWWAEVQQLPRWAQRAGWAAAAIIAALTASNWWLWRSLQTQQAQAPGRPIVVVLRTANQESPAGRTNAAVAIEVDPSRMVGRLRVDQLPPLAPGKVYVLWTVVDPQAPFTTDHKNAILTHVFSVNQPSDRVQNLVLPKAFLDLEYVKALAISVEDAKAPQRHQSPPILIERL